MKIIIKKCRKRTHCWLEEGRPRKISTISLHDGTCLIKKNISARSNLSSDRKGLYNPQGVNKDLTNISIHAAYKGSRANRKERKERVTEACVIHASRSLLKLYSSTFKSPSKQTRNILLLRLIWQGWLRANVSRVSLSPAPLSRKKREPGKEVGMSKEGPGGRTIIWKKVFFFSSLAAFFRGVSWEGGSVACRPKQRREGEGKRPHAARGGRGGTSTNS